MHLGYDVIRPLRREMTDGPVALYSATAFNLTRAGFLAADLREKRV